LVILSNEKVNVDFIEEEMQKLESDDELEDSIDVEKEMEKALAEDKVAELQREEKEMEKALAELDLFELTPESKILKLTKGTNNALRSVEEGLQKVENTFSVVEEDPILKFAVHKGLERFGNKALSKVMDSE